MVNKNIQMKKKTETGWDNLYPLTLNENVFDNNGVMLTTQLENMSNNLNDSITDLQNNLMDLINKNDLDLDELVYSLNDMAVNALNPPENYIACKGDGVTDDTQALQNLIDNFHIVILPTNKTYRVTDTIFVGKSYKQLIGAGIPDGRSDSNATILYDGVVDNKKAVVVLGIDDVGNEPVNDGSGNVLKNIEIDANFKAGFCLYGTYITNESLVDHVVAKQSTEYNMFFARSWFTTFTNLLSKNSKGVGIAFGMPLIFQDNTKITWSTPSLMNAVKINNIRVHEAGQYYSRDHAGTYDPTNPLHVNKGYGLGVGVGVGLRISDFQSERIGGAGLYVYTENDPVKIIKDGYIENTGRYSDLDPATEKPAIIIDNQGYTGGSYYLKDIAVNYNSGGIYHVGTTDRKVYLENIYQPRFLKSLDISSPQDLGQMFVLDNVFHEIDTYNRNPRYGITVAYKEIDTTTSWSMDVLPNVSGRYMVYAMGTGTENSMVITPLEGETYSRSFSDMNTSEFTYQGRIDSDTVKISQGGSLDSGSNKIKIKIVYAPPIT